MKKIINAEPPYVISYFALPGMKTQERLKFGIRCDLDDALKLMSEILCVSVEELTGRKRHDRISEARIYCMYIMHKHLCATAVDTGKIFKRDHSMVLYACKKMKGLILFDQLVKDRVEEIIKKIYMKNQYPMISA